MPGSENYLIQWHVEEPTRNQDGMLHLLPSGLLGTPICLLRCSSAPKIGNPAVHHPRPIQMTRSISLAQDQEALRCRCITQVPLGEQIDNSSRRVHSSLQIGLNTEKDSQNVRL